MSVVTSQSVTLSTPNFGYFGEPGVYYDSETYTEKPPVDKEPVTEEDLPTLKPPKNPSLKLLWLVMSSMMAVQEGSCQYCPTHNGLYPNIENCKCYYKCIEGRPIQKWCPPGQKFDVMSMSCSFPSKTVCAGKS
ncbi:chitin-binding type-2 domain-containing protein [Trichonephila inaurata madagascariensis]|uniref:Chitin-binding type-2 domain-containing protein n=1 Tax=Trichonephila inaurata madagascariensis TaxID=2747483 RepID=A0A8X6WNW6_9ARAC|nr:chitin-binding type-2 domain-containing protein [Trichonephila inaurata madagascariensis]